jgi:guanylate kinase
VSHPAADLTADPNFKIVVLSGPSGVGKTTIVHRLLASTPVPLRLSVSATTRPPRPNEVDGHDYHFLTHEEFNRRLAAGEFLEWAEVHKSGHFYGTLWSELERAKDAGAWALLEIDVEGARNVMNRYPSAITIFLKTPSVDEYERRLRARGTESEEVLQRRLKTAREELEFVDLYRHQIVNDNLDQAVSDIVGILATYQAAPHAG